MFNTVLTILSHGLVPLVWWGYLIVLLGCTQVTVLAVTLYLHRCQAHRALTFHPIVSHFFRFWLWLTTGIETKQWTAIHRKHHAKVETSEDPHSPVTKGIKKVLFEGAELYRLEACNEETLQRYGEGTPEDWIERHLYTRHSVSGVVLLLLLNSVLFGLVGVALWALQMAWIPFFAAGVINGIGHYLGYRNYEVRDASRNIIPFGFFLGGEELHNNHHAFATSAKFSTRWWELDTGWLWIRLLQAVRLAHPKRVVQKPILCESKKHIDTETIKALVMHRFHVMSHYAHHVIVPLLRLERKRASESGQALLRYAKTALVRDSMVMKPAHHQRLAAVLAHFHTLQVVYQLRVKLQAIWNLSTATQKELIEALQEWCQQAEATRLEPLLRFVRHLKTHTCLKQHS